LFFRSFGAENKTNPDASCSASVARFRHVDNDNLVQARREVQQPLPEQGRDVAAGHRDLGTSARRASTTLNTGPTVPLAHLESSVTRACVGSAR
jgi:hypothetical protein